MYYLSSTFSLNMVDSQNPSNNITTPIKASDAKFLLERWETQSLGVKNIINPRHETTVELAKALTHVEAREELVTLRDGDKMIVMLPPKDLITRKGTEIDLLYEDLEKCQFFLVEVTVRFYHKFTLNNIW